MTTIDHVEFLVEERSMEVALEALLPKLLGKTTWKIHEHGGKSVLLKRLPDRLRGYSKWLPQTWRIVVVVDRDNDDCMELKSQLENIARDAGLGTRSTSSTSVFHVVNRIAIEELEAWFFGDWKAVRRAYPKVSARIAGEARYRRPDAIAGGTWEALERVLKERGYFPGGLAKITAARAIAVNMNPARNGSPSFCSLRDALGKMAT